MITFTQYLREASLSRVPCRRCGGSGKFSYNLLHGTMCYGCRGTGYQMVDLERERKAAATRETTRERRQAYHDAMRQAYEELEQAFNAIYGPFDIMTPKGAQDLNYAVARATGKNIAAHRDALVKSQGLVKP